ncbi:MAG: beta-propeller domain-containing protein [Actinobacteria bacterium]|nr:beta-propeller domain-containing protein [Actinomycetota bacterium]MBU1943751.1 beta-propeller domain-containing protein [Actinomycetota bacterium]MBU2688775.1 beta-propeller domain-containing protein [Actinomycetota bacterium]
MKKATVLIMIGILIAGIGISLGTYALVGSGTTGRASRPYLDRFDSVAEFLAAFEKGRKEMFGGYDGEFDSMSKAVSPSAGVAETEGTPHSSTNVQVAGVDEADIVKNDGKYIYAISGGTVFVIDAYPAQSARVVSRIDLGGNFSPREMFITDDRLVVISDGGLIEAPGREDKEVPYSEATAVGIYDISDRTDPREVRTIEYEGSYNTARMIDGDVHVVLTTSPYYAVYRKENTEVKASDIIPRYRVTRGGQEPGDLAPAVRYDEIDTVDPERFTSFLSIVSFDVDGGDSRLEKQVIAGNAESVYASPENLYVVSADRQYYGDFIPEVRGGSDKTTVYKFRFDGPSAKFVTAARVPGTVLNQFSMDESDGFFRIATTVGHVSREGSESSSSVYVLDPGLKVAGKLEGLAPGERIYSARFMGKRAYLVTFKKVDPLFVLDMTDPTAPRVLGELKIPGYSDYLHPYDENHVIGVGKDTVEAAPEEGGNFAWYQGIKIALFDVTDVANPREMHKVVIGDRGTDSYALYDHKAFLFDLERHLLVLPVLLAELTPEQKASPETRDNDYGTYTFQGAYVYDISLDGGIYLKGRITHMEDPAELEQGYGYYGSEDTVQRSLYIGDVLYTVSPSMVKANDLGGLADISTVRLR